MVSETKRPRPSSEAGPSVGLPISSAYTSRNSPSTAPSSRGRSGPALAPSGPGPPAPAPAYTAWPIFCIDSDSAPIARRTASASVPWRAERTSAIVASTRYTGTVLPPFEADTGNLPPGIHTATWVEVVARYGFTDQRRQLLAGLRQALEDLHLYGCRTFYLDGSFITAKDIPGDWDGCWDVEGVDLFRLVREAPLLWDDSRGRRQQKGTYGGDLFPVRTDGPASEQAILRDFTTDRGSGRPKGIVMIPMDTLP